jgi:hypothetical protein
MEVQTLPDEYYAAVNISEPFTKGKIIDWVINESHQKSKLCA